MVVEFGDRNAVTVTETGVGKFQVEVLAGTAAFLADEPVEAGGLGSGPSPYDLLCAALGACTTMTLRLYAERKGWPLERATVRVLHARGADGRDRLAREVTVDGALDETQRRRLLEIAQRCPVHRTLKPGQGSSPCRPSRRRSRPTSVQALATDASRQRLASTDARARSPRRQYLTLASRRRADVGPPRPLPSLSPPAGEVAHQAYNANVHVFIRR